MFKLKSPSCIFPTKLNPPPPYFINYIIYDGKFLVIFRNSSYILIYFLRPKPLHYLHYVLLLLCSNLWVSLTLNQFSISKTSFLIFILYHCLTLDLYAVTWFLKFHFRHLPPFERPLFLAGLRDLRTPPNKCSDTSLFQFISNR